MTNINFVLNIDENYIRQASVTMFSILYNMNKNYRCVFFVFCRNIDSKPKEFHELENKFNAIINFIDSKEYLFNFKNLEMPNYRNKYVSMSTLDRLLMFKYLPDDVEKAFYIDADIIVEKDLSIIYEKFSSPFIFAATVDMYFDKHHSALIKTMSSIEGLKKWCNDPLKFPYFCAGFYLANIKECKKNNIFKEVIDALFSTNELRFADQDALNIVFSQNHRDLTMFLPLNYNVLAEKNPKSYFNNNRFYKTKDIIDAYKNPAIIHYVGWLKPWKTYLGLNFNENWHKYRILSSINFNKLPHFQWKIYHKFIKIFFGRY